MYKILVVDDDEVIGENYKDYFEKYGYEVCVLHNKDDAISYIDKKMPDVALLDIRLKNDPEGGFTICNYIRNISELTPIIIVTSSNKDIDKITASRIDADDYVSKDQSIDVLESSIARVIRRSKNISERLLNGDSNHGNEVIKVGDLIINESMHRVEWRNNPIKLPQKQFLILKCLAERPGYYKSSAMLLEAAEISHNETNTIAVHINGIKNKFKKIDQKFNSIKNEKGIGYKWES